MPLPWRRPAPEHALRDADGIDEREGATLGEQHVDRRSLDELHYENGVPVVVDELEEARDVAVAELGEDLRFLDETLPGSHFAGQLFRHDLQHDRVALRQELGGSERAADVDVAHPAFADLALDPVVADDVADHFSAPSSSQ